MCRCHLLNDYTLIRVDFVPRIYNQYIALPISDKHTSSLSTRPQDDNASNHVPGEAEQTTNPTDHLPCQETRSEIASLTEQINHLSSLQAMKTEEAVSIFSSIKQDCSDSQSPTQEIVSPPLHARNKEKGKQPGDWNGTQRVDGIIPWAAMVNDIPGVNPWMAGDFVEKMRKGKENNHRNVRGGHRGRGGPRPVHSGPGMRQPTGGGAAHQPRNYVSEGARPKNHAPKCVNPSAKHSRSPNKSKVKSSHHNPSKTQAPTVPNSNKLEPELDPIFK